MRSPIRGSGRRLRLAAAGAVVGVGAVAGVVGWSPAAGAESTDRVAFTGSCGVLGTGLGAATTPDVSRVSVPAGSPVEFANQLSRSATLHLDGEPVAEVGPGEAVEITFFDGPVTAAMQASCALGDPAGEVTVEVLEDTRPAVTPPVSPTEPPAGSASGRSGSGGQTTPPEEPAGARTPTAAGEPAPTWSAPAGPVPAAGGTTQGGATQGEPATGWWPGEPAEADPGAADSPERSDEPVTGEDPVTSGGSAAGRATVEPQVGGDDRETAQLTRTAGAPPGDGPIGALALIATVCVVGVSAGAVRTILTQRANRAEWA